MDKLLHQTLRSRGYSVTSARRILFETLWRQDPVTMAELVVLVEGQLDRSSVYRNIDLFEKLGVVHRIPIGWKYKLELSEAFSYHHHHIVCTRCGKVIPIKDNHKLEALVKAIARQHSFKASSHQFEIQGYCLKCSGL